MLGKKKVFVACLVLTIVGQPSLSHRLEAKGGICNDSGLPLNAAEVTDVLQRAAAAFDFSSMTVAVADRTGNVLGLFRKPGATGADDDLAVSLARTGAFFSNNQAPLSSRTVRFISGIHFPPGIRDTPNAALYGIENTNRGCDFNAAFNPGKDFPRAKSVTNIGLCDSTDQSGCGLGVTTGKVDEFDSDPKAVNPGGIPVFRGCTLVGGVGVVVRNASGVLLPNHAEFAAIKGTAAFPPKIASPGVVFLDGIRLPFVKQKTRPRGTKRDVFPPPGAITSGPVDGVVDPDGYLIGPLAGSMLSIDEVDQIVQQSRKTANLVRAAIRLPIGLRARMVISVADLDGTILALYRMPDATVFSIDVAVAKARNVIYFSGPDPNVQLFDLPGVPSGTAVTNRTISFGSQPLYPPGIDGSLPGPFFDLFRYDTDHPCSQGRQATNANQNGVVFFPGSTPLYKDRTLVGGLGISGDGVEQDDVVSNGGAQGFLPPPAIRADQVFIRGVRLPFFKFNRNPFR